MGGSDDENLTVVQINDERDLLVVKGAIPGAPSQTVSCAEECRLGGKKWNLR